MLKENISEELLMFIKNDTTFQAVAQKVAKEEGLGPLSEDELDFVQTLTMKSLVAIAEGADE